MPRCPYLGLEQEGTTPFPFPSSSHHCYTSEEGLPIGQQEQERYCLTKKYSSCPLFVSQPFQEGVADKLPETVAEEKKPEVVVEPPLKETAETRSIREILAERLARAMARQKERKAGVEPPLKETVEPLPTQETLANKLADTVAEEEKPKVVVSPPLKETTRPRSIRGILADRFARAMAKQKERKAAVEPPLKKTAEPLLVEETLAGKLPEAVTPEGKPEIAVEQPPLKGILRIRPEVMPMMFKAWPWIVAGMAFLTLLCMGGLITFRILSMPPEISSPALELPSLLPGTLLLVSVVSFTGALLLIGIFLWIRRVTSR